MRTGFVGVRVVTSAGFVAGAFAGFVALVRVVDGVRCRGVSALLVLR